MGAVCASPCGRWPQGQARFGSTRGQFGIKLRRTQNIRVREPTRSGVAEMPRSGTGTGHWGLNPGPSARGADVIPLNHVPLKSCSNANNKALAVIPNSKTFSEHQASIRVQTSGLRAHGVALGRAISLWRCTSWNKFFSSVFQRWQAGWQAGWGRDEGQTYLGTCAFLKISCEASCCLGFLRGGLSGTQGTITLRRGGKWATQGRFTLRG